MTTQKAKDRAEAIETLRAMLHPGDTVYTIVTHVSRSRMQRRIKAMIIRDGDGEPRHIANISWKVATAIGWGFKEDAVVVNGCGMDLGFRLVYTLARTLFPNGGRLEDSDPVRQHQEKDKGRETNGGYLLKQEWV